MVSVSYITTCMDRLEFLKQSLPAMLAQPDAECVVVDYSCPQRCGEWVEREHPSARVVRVPDQTEFNYARARNAGAAAAQAPWLCFIDCDFVLVPGFGAVLRQMLRPGCTFHSGKAGPDGVVRLEGPPWGPVLIRAEDFTRVGGYDEVIRGWGYEDNDFVNRTLDIGLTRVGYPRDLFHNIDHDDTVRLKHVTGTDKLLTQSVNMCYSKIKRDLSRVSGQTGSLETRRELYAYVRARFDEAVSGASVEFTIPVQTACSMGGFNLERGLRYRITPPGRR
jgi:glycosyltransferase involved in cell wall biosynthesis